MRFVRVDEAYTIWQYNQTFYALGIIEVKYLNILKLTLKLYQELEDIFKYLCKTHIFNRTIIIYYGRG